jgi:hypothetical protein
MNTQPPRTVSVAVTSMPPTPDKPLFKDPSRLLAVAALALSFTTGSFGMYYTWNSGEESRVDTLGKLIDQYYTAQEKLLTLNEDDNLPLMNLLRSQLKANASRAYSIATGVQGRIEDGVRLAVAEINDSEFNFTTAEKAWLLAVEKTQDISVYLYGMRNLAKNQLLQHKTRGESDRRYQQALDAALHDRTKRMKGTAIINGLLPDARSAQAALTHAYWLEESGSRDCLFVVPHYDEALRFIAAASQTSDLIIQTQIVGTRTLLGHFRKIRGACMPPSAALESADYCRLVANILRNAAARFGIYKGAHDKAKAEFASRIVLPDAKRCGINSNSVFYCTWMESDEGGTRAHSEKLVDVLSSASCLGAPVRTEVRAEPAAESMPTINLDFPERGNIKIKRRSFRSTESSPVPYWDINLEIDAQR